MKINCLIVDDEPLARSLLTDYVKKVPHLHLVKACSSAMEALQQLKEHDIDLLFLDVQMPDITGISFLKTLTRKPLVILTTAYSQYALEGYELDVSDYLLKPITFERFLKAVEKISQRLQETVSSPPAVPAESRPTEQLQPYIFIKDGTRLMKVRWDEILYVEGLKDYVTIHTRQQKIISLQRMKTLAEQLPSNKFFRIHNSFIVSLDAIDSIHKEKVQIGEINIPIGDTYKKTFMDFVESNRFNKIN